MIVLETVLLFQMVYYKQLRKIYFALFICIEILLINGLCFAQLIDKDSYDEKMDLITKSGVFLSFLLQTLSKMMFI